MLNKAAGLKWSDNETGKAQTVAQYDGKEDTEPQSAFYIGVCFAFK